MAEKKKKPVCYILAGPNGAGKTTFALRYLPLIVSCRNFINADEIARGISPLDSAAGLLQASKIFLAQLERKITERQDFAFETTLSGRNYYNKIKEWRQAGWYVFLIYLYIPSAVFSSNRVQQRVLQGGHNIPPEDIIRRYPRSIRNLFDYAEICDKTLCLDNSSTENISIFEKKNGSPIEINHPEIFSKLKEIYKNE